MVVVGGGTGKKRGWSLSAAKDLVGVFTGDRWIVCVCVCKSIHIRRESESN